MRGPGKSPVTPRLKVEFSSELRASRRIGRAYLSEISIPQIGVWLEKVRMVEGVKHLETELELLGLSETPGLFYTHVPIEVTRPAEV